MLKKILYLGFLAIVCISWTLSDGITNILVVSEEWEGYSNSDGSGMYFDLLRQVYQPLGISVTTKTVPYIRSTMMVQNKQADIMVGSYADESENILYPQWYFDADDVSAMYLAKNASKWMGEDGLLNKKCAFMRGYELDGYIDVPFKVFEIDDRETGLKMLKAGRVDYLLDNYGELEDSLSAFPEYTNLVEIESIKNLYLYMGFQDNELGAELAGLWDERISQMIDNGELYQLFSEWDSGDWYIELFEEN